MITYLTLDAELLDLSSLRPEEAAFLERCREALSECMPYIEFINLVHGPENPVLEPNQRVTLAVRQHPLYRATRDLADRAGIAQGTLLPAGHDSVDEDPFADETLSIADAATAKGVSIKGVHKAIERGDLIATRGYKARVSIRSLARWGVLDYRQRAGRLRAERVAPATVKELMDQLEAAIATAKAMDEPEVRRGQSA